MAKREDPKDEASAASSPAFVPEAEAPVNGNSPLNVAMERVGLGKSYRNQKLEEKLAQKRAKIAQEEAILESIIVQKICTKDWDSLLPNTGKSIKIGNSNVCVRFRKEDALKQRLWEWHGHLMVYNEMEGYSLEYIYGSYFEPLLGVDVVKLEVGVGLGSMISGVERTNLRTEPGFV